MEEAAARNGGLANRTEPTVLVFIMGNGECQNQGILGEGTKGLLCIMFLTVPSHNKIPKLQYLLFYLGKANIK